MTYVLGSSQVLAGIGSVAVLWFTLLFLAAATSASRPRIWALPLYQPSSCCGLLEAAC